MSVAEQTMRERTLRTALAFLWFGAVPALLAGTAILYLVPPSLLTEPGVVGAFAKLFSELPVTAAAIVFVFLLVLVHYWRFWLPGGRYLIALPASWLAKAERRNLADYERAAELRRWLGGAASGDSNASTWGPRLDEALAEGDVVKLRAEVRGIEGEAANHLRSRRLRYNLGFVGAVAFAAIAAASMQRYAARPYRVLSSSMLPTLEVGDEVLIDRQAYSDQHPPRRGDVVVFQFTVPGQPEVQIKRIIGIPGDKVQMVGDRPVINGWPVPVCPVGSYVMPAVDTVAGSMLVVEYLGDSAYLTLQSLHDQPFEGTVQLDPGSYFVLGDNRGSSADSRSWNGGMGGGVRMQKIEGWARWMLLARLRTGGFDLARSFRAIGREFELPGVDTSLLRQNIERCLREWPRQTLPPRPAPASAALEPGGQGT
jgi:signal peptidase I